MASSLLSTSKCRASFVPSSPLLFLRGLASDSRRPMIVRRYGAEIWHELQGFLRAPRRTAHQRIAPDTVAVPVDIHSPATTRLAMAVIKRHAGPQCARLGYFDSVLRIIAGSSASGVR